MQIHIHSGDAAAAVVGKVVPGRHLVWTDNLFTGPLPATPGRNARWLKARARALAPLLGGRAETLLRSQYAKFAEGLRGATEVTLWFDSCLYDMMLLCEFLVFSRELLPAERPLYLICGERTAAGGRFAGYGELPPEEIRPLPARRRRLTPEHLAEAARAWAAFTAPAPQAWRDLAGEEFTLTPFLAPAAARLLRQLPDGTGLNQLEQQILLAVNGGCSTLERIFRAVCRAEDRPFFGDVTVWDALNTLATAREPLLELHGPAPTLPTRVFPEPGVPALRPGEWTVTGTLEGTRALWGIGQRRGGYRRDRHWVANVCLSPACDWRYDAYEDRLWRYTGR